MISISCSHPGKWNSVDVSHQPKMRGNDTYRDAFTLFLFLGYTVVIIQILDGHLPLCWPLGLPLEISLISVVIFLALVQCKPAWFLIHNLLKVSLNYVVFGQSSLASPNIITFQVHYSQSAWVKLCFHLYLSSKLLCISTI